MVYLIKAGTFFFLLFLNVKTPVIQLPFSSQKAGYYASRYYADNLIGGHVIKLGPGNDAAAEEALAVWPRGLQIGGGINIDNAKTWLEKGAAKVSQWDITIIMKGWVHNYFITCTCTPMSNFNFFSVLIFSI